MATDLDSCTDSRASLNKKDEQHSFWENLYRGFMQVGVEDTVNAITQTINHLDLLPEIPKLDIVDEPDKDSIGGTCGELLGLAGKIVGAGAIAGVTGVASPIVIGLETGAIYSAMTPVKDDENFWENKIEDAAVNALTFGIMTGAAQALETVPSLTITEGQSIAATVSRRIGVGVGSGAIAGASEAELDSLIREGEFADAEDVLYSAARLGAFGSIAGLSEYVARDVSLFKSVSK